MSAGYSTAKVCKFEERDDPNCEKKVPLDPGEADVEIDYLS